MKVGSRVGPAGVLVWAGNPVEQRAEWLAARMAGIGSSDAAHISVPSRYGTALSVWADKVGHPLEEPTDMEAAEWGNLLEDPVARRWAKVHGFKVQRIGIVANREHPWMLCSLDRRVSGCQPGGCPLEVKTRSAWKQGQWREEYPDDVFAQVQWQLAVTGWDHVHLTALIGGQRQVHYRSEAEPEVQELLVTEAAAVWEAVRAGSPPQLDVETANAHIVSAWDKLIAHLEGSVEVDPLTAAHWLEAYQVAKAQARAGEAAAEEAEAKLAALLGTHEVATIGGVPAYARKPRGRSWLDGKALREELPEVHAAYYRTGTTRPVLTVKPGFKRTTTDQEETP